ncbi:MAG: NIL domain-containing protein [Mariprofundales bacterium]|nr:NIL domain-containing protein [Mariprofundales bacterium]
MRLRLYLTFNIGNITKPLIWQLGRDFSVITNIRTAEVKESTGLVGIELDGAEEQIDAAIVWLKSEGVQVEPIEQDVIEG